MTIKAPTSDQLTAALGDGAKAAMAGMVAGPIGALGGGILALASDLVPAIFGLDAKPALSDAAAFITKQSTEAAQVAALRENPDAAAAFRVQALQIAADQQQRRDADMAQLRQMLLEQSKVDTADTANARQMAAALAQSGSRMQWAQPVVSVCVTVGFFLVLCVMLFLHNDINPIVATIVNVLVGVLAGSFNQVVNFWLGSSHGSAEKTQLLAQSVPASMLPSPSALVPAADIPNPNN